MNHQEFYERVAPYLTELEDFRMQQRKKAFVVFPIIFIAAVLFAIFYSYDIINPEGRKSLLWQLFFLSISVIGIWGKAKRDYENEVKNRIIPILLKALESGVNFESEGHISVTQFNNCGLFKPAGRCTGEDLLHGIVDKTKFEISELRAVRQVKKRKNRKENVIFRGLFMVADFNKHFNGYTQIFPDYSGSESLTFFNKSKTIKSADLEVVKLENPEFEDAFSVYSTDQIEARYILSTSLMQRILNLKDYWKTPVYLAFSHGVLYLAISTRKDFLRIKFSEPLNAGNIKTYYDEILDCLDIIEELNLNTRIWTKE